MLDIDEQGLVIVEIAPGVDLDRDIFPNFGTQPRVSAELTYMPDHIFRSGKIGLRQRFDELPGRPVHGRLAGLINRGADA